VNSLIVLVADAGGKNSVKDFGSQEDFLKKISYLFGTQSFVGEQSSLNPLVPAPPGRPLLPLGACVGQGEDGPQRRALDVACLPPRGNARPRGGVWVESQG